MDMAQIEFQTAFGGGYKPYAEAIARNSYSGRVFVLILFCKHWRTASIVTASLTGLNNLILASTSPLLAELYVGS